MSNLDTPSQLSEAGGHAWAEEPLPIWQKLSQSRGDFSDKLALTCLHQPADLYGINESPGAYLRWSYSALNRAVEYFSQHLLHLGVRKGDAIGTFLNNGAEFVIAFWTAHKLGCPFVPINPRNLVNQEEAKHMLNVGQVVIVIVQNAQSAALFDEMFMSMTPMKVKIAITGGIPDNSWNTFAELMRAPQALSTAMEMGNDCRDADELVTILFTSGTTSLPKGCPHTNRTLNAFCDNLALSGRSPKSKFVGVLPNNHAMGYFYVLHFFLHGASVVYPSPTFDANALRQALEDELCTHTCLVPTTLHALIDCLPTDSRWKCSLEDVCLAGASITPQHMRSTIHTLGSRGVSTGFGMTEGSPVWTKSVNDPELLIEGDLTLVGTASPGASIRICEPESNVPVPRGVRGEIHESGPGVIKSYIGNNIGTNSFYNDGKGRQWFITGDQAVMNSEGKVAITGRYKDMIIRGGENIAPAAIETILNKTASLEAQVIGIKDPIAGEVPVAVVRTLASISVKELQHDVRTKMGAAFVPDQIITLKELELDEYPKTSSGKIKKTELAQIVQKYCTQQDHQAVNLSVSLKSDNKVDQTLLDKVKWIWWKACGIDSEHLDINSPVSDFADSITVMRVRDMMRKTLGNSLTTEEMAVNPSILAHVELLQGRDTKKNTPRKNTPIQPPTMDAMSVLFRTKKSANHMKTLIDATIKPFGFEWEKDVTAVIPSNDFMRVLENTGIIDSWNFAIAIISESSTKKQLTKALENVISHHPLLTSIYVLDDQKSAPFYVTLKPSRKMLELCLVDYATVKTISDVQQIAVRYPFPDHVKTGPLFRALIVFVEETNSAAFVMYLHHIIQDASFLRLVYEDLDKLLREPDKELTPHTDFQAWAESYQSLYYSPIATAEVDWFAERLSDLHLHRQALYPAAKVPRQAITDDPDGYDYMFDAPGLLDLKRTHPHLTASVVLKAAMALVDVNRTKHTHALFNNFEAGRGRFPFLPPSMDALGFDQLDASDVAGPTMEAVTNLIEVHPQATTLSFLNSIQADQLELTKRAHAPWRRIIDALNADGSGAGDMIPETHSTQFLTWVPGFLGDYQEIRVAQIAIRAVLGMAVVAGLGGPEAATYIFSMRWDVANYSREEVAAYVADLRKAIEWMTERGNWERGVRSFAEGL